MICIVNIHEFIISCLKGLICIQLTALAISMYLYYYYMVNGRPVKYVYNAALLVPNILMVLTLFEISLIMTLWKDWILAAAGWSFFVFSLFFCRMYYLDSQIRINDEDEIASESE